MQHCFPLQFKFALREFNKLLVIYSEVKKNQAKYLSLYLQFTLAVPHFVILSKISHENFQIGICANSFQDF